MEKNKNASPSTSEKQKALLKALPFSDNQDFECIKRGFIATIPNQKITNQNGQLITDLEINNFLDQSCPDTVNPSLWRNAQSLLPNGLFEVIPGIYQIRGFDMSNMTIIRGQTGYIIIDTLAIAEAAKAGMDLVREHLGDLPIIAVIYTHNHLDHFGGVKGVIDEADVASGKTAVIAPADFMKEVVGKFVVVGPAMGRRAMYQFGGGLPWGPKGVVSGGIGPAHPFNPNSSTSIIPPTREISATGETMTIDGVKFVFQLTPNAEAPAEMNVFMPDHKALCMAETVNGCMHQLYPLRGCSKTRDAKEWVDKLTEAIRLFGKETEVVFTSHFWPRWGHDVIIDYLSSHRDAYKYIHDQTVRMINQGYTDTEVADAITLPESLANRWFNRGHYGDWRQNAREICHQYLGWYDGNPSHLNPLPLEEAGKKYVAAMGGPEAVLSMARESVNNGEYQWAAELVDRIIFSDANNRDAQLLQADILEQLGYQSESTAWRNVYLMAAFELRRGQLEEKVDRPDNTGEQTIPYLLDIMASRLLPDQAVDKQFKINLIFTDPKALHVLSLSNCVLVHEEGIIDEDADGTLTMDKPTFWSLISGNQSAKQLIEGGKLETSGNMPFLDNLASLFEKPPGMFNIVFP